MPSPSPSYTGRMAPYIPCSRCLKKWLVPQSVRWSLESLDKSVARARNAGWIMEEYKPCYCPECNAVTVSGDRNDGTLTLQSGEKAYFIQCPNCQLTFRVSCEDGQRINPISLHCKCGTVTPWRSDQVGDRHE